MIIINLIFATLFLFLVISFFTGAPFVPTKTQTIDEMLRLLKLKRGQKLYDLGSGDGRVLFAAAKQGIDSFGIEINPYLVLYTWIKAWLWGYSKQTTVKWGSLWQMNLVNADAVIVYGILSMMPRLATKLKKELQPGTKIVSHTFELPDLKLIKTQTVGKERLYLYTTRI